MGYRTREFETEYDTYGYDWQGIRSALKDIKVDMELVREIQLACIKGEEVFRLGSDKAKKDWKNNFRYFEQREEFALAMDFVNIISTHFYINGCDVTEEMRRKIYIEKNVIEGSETILEDWDMVVSEIEKYEELCFLDYCYCTLGMSPVRKSQREIYDEYVSCLKAVNEYKFDRAVSGVDNSNVFREKVLHLLKARTKCNTIANFDTLALPKELQKTVSQEMSGEEKTALIEEMMKNMCVYAYGDPIEENYVFDYIIDTAATVKKKSTENILDIKFISNYMELCGINRKAYNRYRNFEKYPYYLGSKKLCFALGVYLEPYCNGRRELVIEDKVEQFMNLHGYTLTSPFASVTANADLLDREAREFLKRGYPLDLIAYELRTNAFSKEE